MWLCVTSKEGGPERKRKSQAAVSVVPGTSSSGTSTLVTNL